jgi:uncharacterized protein (TIGR03083 family)
MTPLGPVFTAPLFAGLADELVGLLRGLSPEDWERPTVAGTWRVRDVAAHLLDGDLRKLSFHRDGHEPPGPPAAIASERDLVAYVNSLNAAFVEMAGRYSPAILTRLLAATGPEVAEFVGQLDPFGPALFPVSWAGEAASANWMDTGREYTERWHHQEQIREATGRPGLLEGRWLGPVIDVSMRALPHGYRDVPAPEGATVAIRIEGPGGGEWVLRRAGTGWSLGRRDEKDASPSAVVALTDDTAWRVFFKALAPAAARERVRIEGDARLGAPFLGTLAVLA